MYIYIYIYIYTYKSQTISSESLLVKTERPNKADKKN